MIKQIKILSLLLSYLALTGLVETIDLVYPHVDQVAQSMRISCG